MKAVACAAQCDIESNHLHAAQPNVTAGTLDTADGIKPEDHVWCERMLPWVKMADGLPRYKHGRNDK